MKNVTPLLLIILLLILNGCDTAGPGPEEELLLNASMEPEVMVQWINQARRQSRMCGNEHYDAVGPVHWNDRLADAAAAHSKDMAENDRFSHTGSDGTNPGKRIEEAGYPARTWGENIAGGYPGMEEVIQGWLDSPGHCAIIMKSRFTEMGSASHVNEGSSYTIYWTLVMAAPSETRVQ